MVHDRSLHRTGYSRICKSITSIGVTGVLPTAKEDAFEAIASVMDQDYEGAVIYGIHSEGPFWARGGENTVGASWPSPNVEETERLIEKAGGKMKVMAIAPELPNAYDVIRCLHRHGIKVACCHTAGHAQDIYDAAKKRLDLILLHILETECGEFITET